MGRLTRSKKRHLVEKEASEEEPDDLVTIISSDNVKYKMSAKALKTHSDYFQGLLESGMKESLSRTVHLPTLPSECVSYIDDFLKKGSISIEEDDLISLSNVTSAASYFLIHDLIKYISELVISWLTADNFDDMREFVDEFMLLDAKEKMAAWVLENGSYYLRSKSFLARSREEAKEILASDDLLVDDEYEVAEAGIRWMEAHKLNEDFDAEELFEARVGLMDVNSLNRCTRMLKMRLTGSYNLCLGIIEHLESFESPEEFYNMHKDVKQRCEDLYMVSLGGFSGPSAGSRELQIAPLDELNGPPDNWEPQFLTSSKEKMPRSMCEHCVCVLRNDIYVIGGQTRYTTDGKNTTKEAHRFNTLVQKWEKLRSMRESRSLFYSGIIGDRIYAVSGWMRPQTVTRTVEEYDPETNTWRYVHRLERGVHEHAGSVLNGKLYISGGYKGTLLGHLDQVLVFDPSTTEHDLGEWVEVAPMQLARSYHVMVAVEEKGLLVAGGVQYHANTDSYEDLHQCEYYDVALNQWTLLQRPLPYGGSCMGHVHFSDKLVLFGGHCFADPNAANKTHEKLQVLDLKTYEWTVGEYTSKAILFPCALVKLPRNFAHRFKAVVKPSKSK